jgi:hypothetical protein
MRRRVKEERASDGRFVIGRTGVEPGGNIIPRRKSADFLMVCTFLKKPTFKLSA